MHTLTQLLGECLQLIHLSLPLSFAKNDKTSILLGLSTNVGKSQEVECLWFAFAPCVSITLGETAEFNKTRLLLM